MSAEAAPLAISDPTAAPRYGTGPLSRWCARALYDSRDEVFVRLSLRVLVAMPLAMMGLGVAAQATTGVFVAASAAYLALWAFWSAPVILMLHNTMHRPFLRSPRWLEAAHPLAMSLLFGIPTGYAQHHLGMHHVEDNLPEDLSSTMRYRRDSFLHFLHYFGRFLFFVLVELSAYLLRKGRRRMARRAIVGELVHLTVIAAALLLDVRFGLVAFAGPAVVVRLLMMIGNWGQHAFLNAARPNNGLANSITCINSGYNRRAFNDGYHIGHHLKANRHWTDMPADFLDHRDEYARADAVVFEGIDFFLVSLLLWTGRWRVLARHFVRLDGRPRSDDDVIDMLRKRVQPMTHWPI